MTKKHELSYNDKHKQKRSWFLIIAAIVLIAIIVLGAVVLFSPKKNPRQNYAVYNGFAFENHGKFWQTTVELKGKLYEVPFYTHPLDIDVQEYDQNVTKYLMDLVNTISPKRNLIIAVSPNGGSIPVLAGVNIGRITGKFYGVQTNSALYIEPDDNRTYDIKEFPVRSCVNASIITPIIEITVNPSRPGIYFDDKNKNCIILAAKNNDTLLETADLLGYKLLGIVR